MARTKKAPAKKPTKKPARKPAKKPTKTKVKAHWRKVDPKTLQDATIKRITKGEAPKHPEDDPLPDDPNDEVDQAAAQMAVGLEEAEKKQRTYTRKLTPAKVKAALRETGGIVLQAAETLGVARRSLYQYISRWPEIAEYLSDLREEILDTAESQIVISIMAGNIQVAQWYLMRMGAKRGWVDKVQQIGANGEPQDLKQSIVRERPTLSPDGPIPASPIL